MVGFTLWQECIPLLEAGTEQSSLYCKSGKSDVEDVEDQDFKPNLGASCEPG